MAIFLNSLHYQSLLKRIIELCTILMLRRKPVPKSKAAALKQGLTPLTSFFKPLREYQESLNNIQPTVQDQQSSSENVSESSTVDLLCETKICKRNAENDFDDLDQSGRKTRRSVCLPEGDEAAQLSSVEELKDGNNAIAEASLPFNPAASSSSTSIENESSPNIFVWCSPAIYFRIVRGSMEHMYIRFIHYLILITLLN